MDLYTIVTGASMGIGKELAIECANRKMNLILLALPGPELEELANDLKIKHGVKVEIYPANLTEKNTAAEFYRWCTEKALPVNILVNNAGIGHNGMFEDSPVEFYEYQIQLNIQALVTLTRLFVPEIKKHKNGHILNLGSTSSLFPVPYKTVYAASKSFVLSFSRALRQELKRTNVNVSCLCPGPVPTNEAVIKRIKDKGFIAKMLVLPGSRVAKIALRGLMKKKAVIVPGNLNKFYLFIFSFLPRALIPMIVAKMFKD